MSLGTLGPLVRVPRLVEQDEADIVCRDHGGERGA